MHNLLYNNDQVWQLKGPETRDPSRGYVEETNPEPYRLFLFRYGFGSSHEQDRQRRRCLYTYFTKYLGSKVALRRMVLEVFLELPKGAARSMERRSRDGSATMSNSTACFLRALGALIPRTSLCHF